MGSSPATRPYLQHLLALAALKKTWEKGKSDLFISIRLFSSIQEVLEVDLWLQKQ